MQYVFDGIIIVVLILFTVIGAKRGLIKSAADLLGGIVALVAAAFLSSPIAKFIYEKLFAEGVELKVRDVLELKGMEISEYFSEELPEFVTRWLEYSGITPETVAGKVSSTSSSAAEVVTDTLEPMFIGLINVFVVIILFLLFMIIIKALANLLTGLFKLPILNEINGLLGGVIGLALGAVILWVVVAAFSYFEPMIESTSQAKLNGYVENSTVCKFLRDINPVEWIFE